MDPLVDHHDRQAATGGLTLLHVSKFPPSSSGIGLYAALFETSFPQTRVLRRPSHPDPTVTQQLRSSIAGLFAGLKGARGVDIIHVELGGRALAEFYFVLGLLMRRKRPWTVITCHDVPSLVGATMLFTAFDRRGLRRLGLRLSSSLGAVLERRVARGTDTVVALTRNGARVLADRHGRAAHFLGHVIVGHQAPAHKEPVIFLPGYVGEQCPIADIARIAYEAPPTPRGPWRVVVGAGDQAHINRELAALKPEPRAAVENQGLVDEAELTATFLKAAAAVRFGSGHNLSNHLAASGPVALALGCGCAVLTDDPRPAVRELADEGLISQTSTPLEALRALLSGELGSTLAAADTDRALGLYGPGPTSTRYWAALREDASAAIATAPH